MTPITSLYIPRIQCAITAEMIAHILDRNGIAQVNKVLIEPCKRNIKNGLKYNSAYIGIKSWHDSESAYNFIERLRNPTREARLIYCDDNWWPVYINKYHSKIASKKRVLTVFEEKDVEFSDEKENNNVVVANHEFKEVIKIDVEKTKLLRNIIASFKNKDVVDFQSYIHEMDEERYMWSSE